MADGLRSDEFYAGLDAGIRFVVKVLHAAGITTGQSCEGGPGHAYPKPTVDLWGDEPTTGFAALHALAQYGIDVVTLSRTWRCQDDMPVENFWRIELRSAIPDRADQWPMFVHDVKPLMFDDET